MLSINMNATNRDLNDMAILSGGLTFKKLANKIINRIKTVTVNIEVKKQHYRSRISNRKYTIFPQIGTAPHIVITVHLGIVPSTLHYKS